MVKTIVCSLHFTLTEPRLNYGWVVEKHYIFLPFFRACLTNLRSFRSRPLNPKGPKPWRFGGKPEDLSTASKRTKTRCSEHKKTKMDP